MFKKTNAQFAIEFIVLIAFMFIIFLGFTAVIASKVLEAKENERQEIAEDIATLAKNEIDLARSVSDGYSRTFNLPTKVSGNSYTIEIVDNRELVVNYLDKEHVLFLQENIVGNIATGLNEIKKVNGIVYLKHIAECDDGIDNDGDGAIDLSDAGCIDSSDNDETNCGDNVCEGFESCSSCSSDCGTCPSLIALLMKSTSNAISFDNNGNVILKGEFQQNSNPQPTADDEFIFKDVSGNDVAIVNLVTGNMFISGSLFENQATLTPSPTSDDFIIKNPTGEVVSYIDDSGNFYLKGTLTENGNP